MAVCCGWKLGGSEAERGRLFPEREQGEGRGQTSRTPGPAHPGKEHRARRQKGEGGVYQERCFRSWREWGLARGEVGSVTQVVKLATTVSLPASLPACHMVATSTAGTVI